MSKKILLPILSGILLTGCLDDSSNESSDGLERFESALQGSAQCTNEYDMAIQTVAPDYSSSSVAFACNTEGGITDNVIIKDKSDFSISAGDKLYHLGRDKSHTVSQYDFTTTNLENWSFSSNDNTEDSSNPYNVIEVNANKAYIIRYNRSKVWIINPAAQNEQDFKIGEIDLSHYQVATAETVNMSDAVLHDGKLFVAMQRISNGEGRDYSNESMIAVIDTTTDSEIDTTPGNSTDGKAIILAGSNVQALTLVDDTIYSASRGNYNDIYGALESINTFNYSVTTLIEGSESQGHIVDVAAVSNNNIYFLADFSGYDAAGDYEYKVSLLKYSDNAVSTLISESFAHNFSEIEKDNNGNLWVAHASPSNPGVYRIDTTSDTADLFLSTELNPSKIAFRK